MRELRSVFAIRLRVKPAMTGLTAFKRHNATFRHIHATAHFTNKALNDRQKLNQQGWLAKQITKAIPP
jgi:hypothetical protein